MNSYTPLLAGSRILFRTCCGNGSLRCYPRLRWHGVGTQVVCRSMIERRFLGHGS
jgi:hypothetical protein